MLPSALLSLFQAALMASVSVQGAASCPDPALVAERLRQLLPESPSAERLAIARLDPLPTGLQVQLLSADGTLVGERMLPGQHPCDQLADAAAVMIATWVDPRSGAGLQAPPPAERALGLNTRAASGPGRRRWDLGASLGASLSADGMSPAVQVSAGADVLGPLLGLRLEGLLTGWAETPLGGKAARWRRTSFALAPRAHHTWSWLTGELHAGPALAWLQVEGSGFAPTDTRSQGDLVVGAAGGARLALSRARWQPFLSGALAFWPVRSLVYALPDPNAVALPRTQLALTLGVSYRR
jgi:hypothetical protein